MLQIENLKKLKLLIVEDERNIAELLKDAIGEYFLEVEIAYDGEEGLFYFDKIKPDIVITDIMIPKISGLEMAKKIKNNNPNQNIIILSAYSDTKKLLNAIDVGVVKYFIKPFDPDELMDYISSISEKILKIKEVSLKDGFIYKYLEDKLYKNNSIVKLTNKELTFIKSLLNKKILSNNEIKKLLWSDKVSDERVRTFIKRFREKTSKEFLQNISSQGYTLV